MPSRRTPKKTSRAQPAASRRNLPASQASQTLSDQRPLAALQAKQRRIIDEAAANRAPDSRLNPSFNGTRLLQSKILAPAATPPALQPPAALPCIQRFLNANNGWKENDEEPRGIPARKRKGGEIEITRDGGVNWEAWDKQPVPADSIQKWPGNTAPARQEPASVTEKPPSRSIEEIRPYDRGALVESSMEKIGSYLSTSDRANLAGAVGSSTDADYQKTAKKMLQGLNPVELMAMRQISRTSKAMADELIWGLMSVSGMSSFEKTMGSQIQSAIQVGAQFIKMAADQVDGGIVAELLQNDPHLAKIIRINYGQSKKGNFAREATVNEAQGPTRDRSSKMHNKFLVQGSTSRESEPARAESVITGSSNMTYSAQSLNTESMVVLKNPIVAAYFNHFFTMITNRVTKDSAKGKEFSRILAQQNAEQNKVRMAMEPFVGINDFVKSELKGADTVVMRMFVISVWGRDNVIDAMCTMARSGVRITAVLDSGQYEQSYVKDAVTRLKQAGANIVLQKSPTGSGNRDNIMHDKMILAHYPETRERKEKHTVMMGSSGFTKNVFEHMNYENMLAIDDKALYEYFMTKHHLPSLKARINKNL